MKNDIEYLFSEYMSRLRYDKYVLKNEKYLDLKDEILKLQKELSETDFTEHQKKVVNDLLKADNEINDLGIRIIYFQAFKDCISLLQTLDILKIGNS
ncbi:hypothetical protein IMSAG249_01470 [Lachnospiraceae bacterium]|jgi:hypothetical protein|nr:hypothetical protein IMSAGC009_01856 [Lachnospiraceae bacterium]GFI69645.1 hypothetical protein IMSAG249_01470 [Lachnospiraceae bacterium]